MTYLCIAQCLKQKFSKQRKFDETTWEGMLQEPLLLYTILVKISCSMFDQHCGVFMDMDNPVSKADFFIKSSSVGHPVLIRKLLLVILCHSCVWAGYVAVQCTLLYESAWIVQSQIFWMASISCLYQLTCVLFCLFMANTLQSSIAISVFFSNVNLLVHYLASTKWLECKRSMMKNGRLTKVIAPAYIYYVR